MLYLVRHAKAGSRSEWREADELRPLSKAGFRQAEALGRRLAKRNVGTLLSSPFLRCVETLEPLAHLTRQRVVTDDRLAEGSDVGGVLELLASLPEESVLCSHGDVIPEVMSALQRRGCEFTSAADWRKATVWVLRRDDAGAITHAKVWPPPDA